jgi:hypothetical protein
VFVLIGFGLMTIGSLASGALLSSHGRGPVLWVPFVPLALAIGTLAVVRRVQANPAWRETA